eukprot:3926303-Pyramimonas_sp.AAC.1
MKPALFVGNLETPCITYCVCSACESDRTELVPRKTLEHARRDDSPDVDMLQLERLARPQILSTGGPDPPDRTRLSLL